MGREDRVFRQLDEDRAAGVQDDGRKGTRFHQLGLPDRRKAHRAGHRCAAAGEEGGKSAPDFAGTPGLQDLAMEQLVTVARAENGVARLTIDYAAKANSLSRLVMRQIIEALGVLSADEDLRAV